MYDTSIASRWEKPIFVLFILLINVVLPWLESTPFVPNYRLFDFFNPKFDHFLIKKFVQNITSFVGACFIGNISGANKSLRANYANFNLGTGSTSKGGAQGRWKGGFANPRLPLDWVITLL